MSKLENNKYKGKIMRYENKKLVDPVRLPEQIAKILTDSIYDGTFKPCGGLPSEKQMSYDFSVSRSVVREAISILKHDGLVETKQGAGVFVSANPFAGTFRFDGQFEEGNDSDLQQLFQLRLYVEAAAAELAAHNISENQIKKLRTSLVEIENSVQSGQADSNSSIQADLDFHNVVSQASDNKYLKSFIQFLNAKLESSVRAGRSNSARQRGLANLVLEEHVAILNAIENGDSKKARTAMETHIRKAAQRLKLNI